MDEGALETVLRLVAEGRLTAEEASPILEVLDAQGSTAGRPPSGAPSINIGRDPIGTQPGVDASASGGREAGTAASSGRSLRVEVREAGRSVVNLRLPLAMGRFAIDRIPGLSVEQVDRVRAALNSGMTGPVFVVDEGGDSVRITIE